MAKRKDIKYDVSPHPQEENPSNEPILTPPFNTMRDSSDDEYLIADFDNNLPETCTILYGPDGRTKVYLLGTSHFSLKSQNEVSIVMRNVKPQIVMLELCLSRKELLQKDEATIIKENEMLTFAKVIQNMKEQGTLYGLVYSLFINMTAKFTAQLGMAPGGEFRRAFQEAKRIDKIWLHVGDRPIQVTLKRALAALGLWKKIKLFWHLFTSDSTITPEDVETCKKKDVLLELLSDLSENFPELERVFIHERDIYMTHSLQLVMGALMENNTRWPDPKRIVAIVGMGHVPGIQKLWGTNVYAHLEEVMTIPQPSNTSKVIKVTLKLTMLGCLIWGCYKILPTPKFLQ